MNQDDKKNNKKVDDSQDIEQEEKEKKPEEKTNKKIQELEERATDFENRYKRVLADYQNLERRVAGERRELIQSANKQLILRLLPVLDILMLAKKHVDDKGLELSIQQFLDVLLGEGVKKIDALGNNFDPNTMEGVEIVEGSAEDDGKVIEELRSGYTLSDRVLRPAQVRVGKKSD